ncbi:hypothetical protein SBRCBS47491_007039 [Sporothrix bragantina]|uniref:DUF7136 domain-containing protein n=1 Tax=Sporothrix bragantina TaxID=671064 RepID=A0ABP0C9V9_9PEZI
MTEPPKAPRRIITGHNEHGKAVVAVDDRPEIAPRAGATAEEGALLRAAVFWGSSTFPSDNTTPLTKDATDPHARRTPAGGCVLRVSDMGPGLSSPLHRTISLDYAILLAGDHVEIELDDGAMTRLEVGDIVVQRGTIHAWHNRALSVLLAGLMDVTPVYGDSLAVDVLGAPQTVSFALTYPRSETYTTASRMPVVFAISNPQYAGLLAPKISFSIANYDIFEGTCPVYVDSRNFTIDLQSYNLSSPSTPDPFYLTAQFDCLDFETKQWFFAWSVETSRANVTIPSGASGNGSFSLDSIPHTTVTDQGHFIFETVKSGTGGNPIDLVAGTADSSCDVVPYSHQIDVVAVAEGSCSGSIVDFPSCAVVANDTGFRTSTPASSASANGGGDCGGVINATEADIIKAQPESFKCPEFPMAHVPCNASETVQRPSNVTSTSSSTTATPNASSRLVPGNMAGLAVTILGLGIGILLL